METVIHTPSLETKLLIISDKMNFISDALSALGNTNTQHDPCEVLLNTCSIDGCSHICGEIADELVKCMSMASDLGGKTAGRTA